MGMVSDLGTGACIRLPATMQRPRYFALPTPAPVSPSQRDRHFVPTPDASKRQ
jgi:hypothetical protein